MQKVVDSQEYIESSFEASFHGNLPAVKGK